MLVEFVRLVKGSVDFEISGRFPERFLNLAAQRGIDVRDPRPGNKKLLANMSARDYRNIRPTAKSAGVRLKMIKKHGFPFFAMRYKTRLGIPVGAAAGLLLLLFLSCFVWSFEVVGAQNVSETRVLSALAAQGVRPGSIKFGLDAAAIKRELLPQLSELSWLSVNIMGSTVRVEVREKSDKPPIEPQNPSNIIAAKDGVITKINALRGNTLVTEGSGVSKGELMISGVSETAQNKMRFVRARAEVFADINSVTELSADKEFDYYSLTENYADRRRLKFLWWEFPASISFNSFGETAYEEKTELATLGGNELPLGFKTETAREVRRRKVTLDRKKAEEIFTADLLLNELFAHGEAQVKSRNIAVSEDENGFTCRADYIYNENIAETAEFSVTEN